LHAWALYVKLKSSAAFFKDLGSSILGRQDL